MSLKGVVYSNRAPAPERLRTTLLRFLTSKLIDSTLTIGQADNYIIRNNWISNGILQLPTLPGAGAAQMATGNVHGDRLR
jgi:hypothetical protein